MESEHRSKPSSDTGTHPVTTVHEGNLSTTGKKLGSPSHPTTAADEGNLSSTGKKLGSPSPSSSSSRSSSSSGDPFQDDENEPSKSTAGTTGLPKLPDDAQLTSKNGEKNVPSSSIFHYEQSSPDLPVSTLSPAVSSYSSEMNSNNVPTTQSPPVQVMERSGDASSYRIPSSVFSRTKSTTPMEWSVASNESLLSIHMGNMSFTRDHFLLMGRSGELGIFKSGELVRLGEQPTTSGQLPNFWSTQLLRPGEPTTSGQLPNFWSTQLLRPGEPTTSGQLPNFSSTQPLRPGEPTTSGQLMNFSSTQAPDYKGTEIDRKTANLDQGLGIAEAAAAETMREVLRANEEHRSKEHLSLAKGAHNSASNNSQHSDESGTSMKSFQFPILTGEGHKSGSLKVNSKQHQHHPQTPAANPTARTSWFSCFACCPFCS